MKLSRNRMINLIQDLAQASNSPSIDDVKVDSDKDMRKQAGDYLGSVETVDLENSSDYEATRVKDAELLQNAKNTPGKQKKKEAALKSARKAILLNWLERRKPAAFSKAGAEQWVTTVIHGRYSDEYANYGGQKFDYSAMGGFSSVVRELAKSKYGVEITHVFEPSSSEFKQLVSSRENTAFSNACAQLMAGEDLDKERSEAVVFQFKDSVSRFSTRADNIYQRLKYLRLLNLGLSSQGTGRMLINQDGEQVFVPCRTYNFVLFPKHFNSSKDDDYAFMWINEKWVPVHCSWPSDTPPEELS